MLSDSQDPGPGHGLNVMGPVIMTHPPELEMKVIRRFPKISQSRRRPLLAATSAFIFKTLC